MQPNWPSRTSGEQVTVTVTVTEEENERETQENQNCVRFDLIRVAKIISDLNKIE